MHPKTIWTRIFRKYGTEIKSKAKMPDYDFKPKPYKGPCYDEIVNIRKNNTLNSNTAYKEPLLLHQGSMQWVYDHKGCR